MQGSASIEAQRGGVKFLDKKKAPRFAPWGLSSGSQKGDETPLGDAVNQHNQLTGESINISAKQTQSIHRLDRSAL
jgi:hypothetical protein